MGGLGDPFFYGNATTDFKQNGNQKGIEEKQ